MPDSTYYVAINYGVNLSDLSFEVESWEEGIGAIKGIPTSKIADLAGAAVSTTEYNTYNAVAAGTAYTIDDKNWHEYVTVAGYKWATMNIGANSPQEAGEYFAWGSTVGQAAEKVGIDAFATPFDWEHAPFNNGQGNYNETFFASAKNTECPNGVLALKNDAANVKWGGAWRMPTKDEFEDLGQGIFSADGCSFGTAPNLIFFPAVSAGQDTELLELGFCDYWSSSLNISDPQFAYLLWYSASEPTLKVRDKVGRCGGCTIRAIIDEPDAVTPPSPIVLWEGEAVADGWANQPYLLHDGGPELMNANATEGQEVRFYITAIDDNWKLQIVEGHWSSIYCCYCSVGADTEDGLYTEYDLDTNGGYISLTLTQAMLDAAFMQQYWGGTFIANGDNVKITKITLY